MVCAIHSLFLLKLIVYSEVEHLAYRVWYFTAPESRRQPGENTPF